MKNIFFSADPHYFHANVINLCNRPFANITEMHEALISKWNAKVKPDDDVYLLGDVSFKCPNPPMLVSTLNKLNGNIFLIKGNHEKDVMKNAEVRARFTWIKDYYELDVPDKDVKGGFQKICLFHFSQRSWNGSFRGGWHLFGHSHGNLDSEPWGLSFDVGVDSHNYEPISYDEVKALMKTRIPNPR